MSRSSSPYEFEVPWRPNFEARMVLIWSTGALLILLISYWAPVFRGFGAMLAIGCAIGGAIRGVQAYRRMVVDKRLDRKSVV